jgi:hypothetical protein
MKGLVSRRQRVLRVRHVQHAMAVAETARARDEADGLARNIDRLNKVRGELFETEARFMMPSARWRPKKA